MAFDCWFIISFESATGIPFSSPDGSGISRFRKTQR